MTQSLLRRHPFGCWLTAATVSTLGDAVSFFALGWVAAGLGADAAGIVLTVESVPLAVLVLVGGVAADRYGIRRLMWACDLGSAVVMTTLAVGSAFGTPLWGLALAAFASGTAAAVRRPAEGVFPRLFGEDGLDRRLATVASCSQVARAAGPTVGGVLVGATGLTGAAALDAASFLLVLAVLLTVRPAYDDLGAGRAEGPAPWRRVVDAARTAVATPGVRPTLLTVAGLATTVLPLVMVAVPLAGRSRGWNAATTGAVSSGWILGGLAVTLLVARQGAPRAGVAASGPLVAGAGTLLLVASRHPVPATVATVVVGVGTSLLTTALVPGFVARTPADMLARFQSLLQLAQTAPVLVATPALAWACGTLGVDVGLALTAAVLCATAVAARSALASDGARPPRSRSAWPGRPGRTPSSWRPAAPRRTLGAAPASTARSRRAAAAGSARGPRRRGSTRPR